MRPGLRTWSDNFSLTFEIRTVDGVGEPTAAVLASTVVEHITATSALSDQPVAANFSPAVPLVAGEAYALTVTGAAGQFSLVGNLNDICPDGRLFSDNDLDNDFRPSGADDMVYTLTVI